MKCQLTAFHQRVRFWFPGQCDQRFPGPGQLSKVDICRLKSTPWKGKNPAHQAKGTYQVPIVAFFSSHPSSKLGIHLPSFFWG